MHRDQSSYASAYFNKANLYANDGDYVSAVKVYREFLDLEPEHIQAWCYWENAMKKPAHTINP